MKVVKSEGGDPFIYGWGRRSRRQGYLWLWRPKSKPTYEDESRNQSQLMKMEAEANVWRWKPKPTYEDGSRSRSQPMKMEVEAEANL